MKKYLAIILVSISTLSAFAQDLDDPTVLLNLFHADLMVATNTESAVEARVERASLAVAYVNRGERLNIPVDDALKASAYSAALEVYKAYSKEDTDSENSYMLRITRFLTKKGDKLPNLKKEFDTARQSNALAGIRSQHLNTFLKRPVVGALVAYQDLVRECMTTNDVRAAKLVLRQMKTDNPELFKEVVKRMGFRIK